MGKPMVGGTDEAVLRGLSEAVSLLKSKLPLARLKVRVLYVIHSDLGKRVSHVRPCFECHVHGNEWPCSCLEIVLVSNFNGKRDPKLSLMHEWGHAYLCDKADPLFALTVPCEGYEESLEQLMLNISSHSIIELSCDTIVDYVVSKRIDVYRKHVMNSIKGYMKDLLTIIDTGSKPSEMDPVICLQVASSYIIAKALEANDLISDIKSNVVMRFKSFNCDIRLSILDDIVRTLREGDYLKAYKTLLNTFLTKYFDIKTEFIKVKGKDSLTGQEMCYRCLKLRRTPL